MRDAAGGSDLGRILPWRTAGAGASAGAHGGVHGGDLGGEGGARGGVNGVRREGAAASDGEPQRGHGRHEEQGASLRRCGHAGVCATRAA